MGSRAWHLVRAKHHKAAADHLRDTEWEDWAAVALAYAAHQMVHSSLSGEPDLPKDERHPRKHTAPPGAGSGGRGTNQLVNALFPEPVAVAYASLFEAGRRTRYDLRKLSTLNASTYRLLELQYRTVEDHCKHVNASRPDIPTEQP